jgi:hypothetical protein
MTSKLRVLVWASAILLGVGLVMLPGSIKSAAGPAPAKGPAMVQDKEAEGKIVAKIDFTPEPNGFGFHNYGGEGDASNDLGAADMIDLFGAENVCASGNTAEDCQLTEPAQAWIESQLKSMNGGHCEGMAVVSLRFMQGKEFRGKSNPSSFEGGIESVYGLKLEGALRNYIAHYFVTQSVDEVAGPTREISQKSPGEVLDLLIQHLHDGKDPVALGIYHFREGRRVGGHAVTPFAVEDMGEDVFRIHIYDNNYPGETKFLTVHKKEETWSYRTTTKPGEAVEDYQGDANSHTLEITPESLRDATPFTCPFCSDDAANSEGEGERHHAARAAHPDKPPTKFVGFSMSGEGDMLITDAGGKRVGFDFKSSKFVNEIAGSNVIFEKGGLNKNFPPQINLPLGNSTKPYTIALSGKSLKRGVDADLDVEGPGFVVGFSDVKLDPNESLKMTASPDGRELSFTASGDGQTPDIFITIESGRKHPTYMFEIAGLKLAAGKTVTMRLDIAKEKLFFKDDDAGKNNYNVRVQRINPDGSKNFYEHDDLAIGKGDSYEMDFSKWDGKGEMCFEEDDEGNGFDDDKCVEEPNVAKPPKKTASIGGRDSILLNLGRLVR